jgi:hypothetical protein
MVRMLLDFVAKAILLDSHLKVLPHDIGYAFTGSAL